MTSKYFLKNRKTKFLLNGIVCFCFSFKIRSILWFLSHQQMNEVLPTQQDNHTFTINHGIKCKGNISFLLAQKCNNGVQNVIHKLMYYTLTTVYKQLFTLTTVGCSKTTSQDSNNTRTYLHSFQ